MQVHGFFVVATGVSALVVSLAFAAIGARSEADDAVIRSIVQEEATAWIRGDAVAYSRHFAEDGVFTNILGQFFTGHDAFLRQHDYLFKGPYRGTTLHVDIVSLKFVRPDVAIVHVLSSVTGFREVGAGIERRQQRAAAHTLGSGTVKENKDWKIVDYHNVDVKSQTAVPEPQTVKSQ